MSLGDPIHNNKRTWHDDDSPTCGSGSNKRPTKRLSNDSTCSTDTTANSSERSMKSCVCFDLQVMVRLIPHVNDYTEDEMEELWYNRYEKQAMIEGALKAAADLEPKDELARGLEQFTWEGSCTRRENRQRAAACIFREQARLRRLFTKNGDELLGKAAAHITKPCQDQAHQLAHKDEMEVYPQLYVKLPPPTADEFPQKQQPLRRLSGRITNLFGWLQGERERWLTKQ